MEANLFRSLRLGSWRQFYSVDISFHPHLTVLTGANGAGKSTILNILSNNLGVARPYLAVPTKTKSGTAFFPGIYRISEKLRRIFGTEARRSENDVGDLVYTNGTIAHLIVPQENSLSYSLNVQDQQPVAGFHIPSHRLLPVYRRLPNEINIDGISARDAFSILLNEAYTRYRGDNTNESLIYHIKRIITHWAIKGEGNTIIESDLLQQAALQEFENILTKVIPADIGFEEFEIRYPDVLLKTRSGTFLIDAASGGLVTIIEIAALIFAASIHFNRSSFAVSFDEPENHLHPALQRTLMPALVDAFPNVQFIVATHSPFIVSSLKDSNVYVLRFIESDRLQEIAPTAPTLSDPSTTRRVETVKLDYANKATSADETLREVLGVPVTLPSWVEQSLTTIVEGYQSKPLTKATLEELRHELEQANLTDLFSEALSLLGRRR